MVKYTLTYLPVRGRGETIRMVLAAGCFDWVEKTVTFEELPSVVPDCPFKQVPIIEFDGKQLGQSGAITRYLAKKAGFYGNSRHEQAQIDGIYDSITDARETVAKFIFVPDEEKVERIKEFATEYMPKAFQTLEKKASQNPKKSGFFVGNSMTIADIHFFATIDGFQRAFPDAPLTLDKFPALKKVCQHVRANDGLRKYIDARPKYAF